MAQWFSLIITVSFINQDLLVVSDRSPTHPDLRGKKKKKAWLREHLDLGAYPRSSLWVLSKSLGSVFPWLASFSGRFFPMRWQDGCWDILSTEPSQEKETPRVSWKPWNGVSLVRLDLKSSCELVTGARGWDAPVVQAWVLYPGRSRGREVKSPNGTGGAVFRRKNGL